MRQLMACLSHDAPASCRILDVTVVYFSGNKTLTFVVEVQADLLNKLRIIK